MSDDILLAKAAVIERALRRVRAIYAADPTLADLNHLDALTLNVERACQGAIDMAMHVVAREHLGLPQSQAQAFQLLADAGKLDVPLTKAMRGMCGFRNILVHQYQEPDQNLLEQVAESHWQDLVAFTKAMGCSIQV